MMPIVRAGEIHVTEAPIARHRRAPVRARDADTWSNNLRLLMRRWLFRWVTFKETVLFAHNYSLISHSGSLALLNPLMVCIGKFYIIISRMLL